MEVIPTDKIIIVEVMKLDNVKTNSLTMVSSIIKNIMPGTGILNNVQRITGIKTPFTMFFILKPNIRLQNHILIHIRIL